ncbi:g3064 [Coccomyxa elongata]
MSSASYRSQSPQAFRTKAPRLARAGRQAVLEVQNFKFMKDLGLKKPAFLPDFGKEKRKALLDRFFTNFDVKTYDELLADSFEFVKLGEGGKTQSKRDFISLVLDHALPAIPDLSWGHATDGAKDDDGYSIVIVQVTGHHTGTAFTMPRGEFPPIEASGKRVLLEEEKLRVKVEDGQIQRMELLPVKDGFGGTFGLYKALGGKVPA